MPRRRAGFRVFDFGRSREGTGPYHFKRHWGFEPQPLPYQYVLLDGAAMPNLSPSNPRMRVAVEAWKRLPFGLTKLAGPRSRSTCREPGRAPMMRILMLAHRIPYPPHTGDKVRAFHVARHLARRHDLALACVADDTGDLAGIEVLRATLGRVECARQRRSWALARGAMGMARGVPITLSYFDAPPSADPSIASSPSGGPTSCMCPRRRWPPTWRAAGTRP